MKEEKVRKLFENIKEIIYSDSFIFIINTFDGKTDFNNFKEYIFYLNDFANKWDYRNNKERFEISIEKLEKQDELLNAFIKLGFVNATLPNNIPKYILPLGGARLSNYRRCKYSKEIIDKFKITDSYIVTLSAMRPINDLELESINTYGLGAKTEYDAINRSLEIVFNLKEYQETLEEKSNPNLGSAIRKYNNKYCNNNIVSLSAPSSLETRRANTRDSFEYFLKKFHIEENDNVLLVTSQIYTFYQYFSLIDLAIDNNFYIECVGTEMDITSDVNIKLYLQELKGMINAIYKLCNKYENYL
mgnify:CR=1 FL=1